MSGKKGKKITFEEFLHICDEGTCDGTTEKDTAKILAAIEAGAEVNGESYDLIEWWERSVTPLTLCMFRNGWWYYGEMKRRVIWALLEAGADVGEDVWVHGPEASHISWFSPLSWAAMVEGNAELVKAILDRGADPNTWVDCEPEYDDEIESGPLLCMLIPSDLEHEYEWDVAWDGEIFKLLLDAGADIDATDARGRTPLRIALERVEDDRGEIVSFLLEAGADIRKLGERQNRTLFELAMEQGPEWEVGEWEPETYSYMFEYLLHIGADVNEQNEDGQTALMWAVRERKFEYVLKLLEAGADVNLRDEKGRTALMYLYGFNYAHYFDPDQRPDDTHVLDIIDALTGAGAGGAEADEDGMTALMYAAEKTTMPEVLTALLGAGSDPAARDNLGLYAYDYAMKNEALRGTVDFAFLTFSALENAATSGKAINNNKEE